MARKVRVRDKVLERVRDFFTGSSDFNGILLSSLSEEFDTTWPKMRVTVRHLVRDGEISLAFASHSMNPHIKRLPELPVEEQLSRLAAEGPWTRCAERNPVAAGAQVSVLTRENRVGSLSPAEV